MKDNFGDFLLFSALHNVTKSNNADDSDEDFFHDDADIYGEPWGTDSDDSDFGESESDE